MLVFELLSHGCNLESYQQCIYIFIAVGNRIWYLKVTFYSYIIASVGLCSSSVDQKNWYFVTSYIFGQKWTYLFKKKKKMYFVYSHIDKSVKSAKFGILKSIFNIHIKNHQSLSESHFCLTISNLILTCFNDLTVWSTLFSKIFLSTRYLQ